MHFLFDFTHIWFDLFCIFRNIKSLQKQYNILIILNINGTSRVWSEYSWWGGYPHKHTWMLKFYIHLQIQYIKSWYQEIHFAFLCGRMKVLHLICDYTVSRDSIHHHINIQIFTFCVVNYITAALFSRH